jgi:hypothetical protein
MTVLKLIAVASLALAVSSHAVASQHTWWKILSSGGDDQACKNTGCDTAYGSPGKEYERLMKDGNRDTKIVDHQNGEVDVTHTAGGSFWTSHYYSSTSACEEKRSQYINEELAPDKYK